MGTVRLGLTVALLFGLGIRPAAAIECPLPSGASPSLASLDQQARLQFIVRTLVQTAQSERRYALGWSLTYAALSGGAWLLYPLASPSDPGQLRESAWNSGTSAFAALFVLYAPLVAAREAGKVNKLLSAQELSPCAQLAESERVLKDVANRQAGARRPLAHIGNVAFNVGLGLILGYALQRPKGAAMATSVGVLLGEVMIATRPTDALRGLASYQQGSLEVPSPSLGTAFALIPTLTNQTYSLSLGGAF